MYKLTDTKKLYYDAINRKAYNAMRHFQKGRAITVEILNTIHDLYTAETTYKKGPDFESAYHQAITSDFEYYIARILYYLSKVRKKKWKVLLRSQYKKTAPDIRIQSGKKTIAIVEIKVKAGWMQCVFSEKRFNDDRTKSKENPNKNDPQILVNRVKNQLKKYKNIFGVKYNRVFVLLPSFIHVHRKKGDLKYEDYINFFSKKTKLPKNNLIMLSKNPSLDLSDRGERKDFNTTDMFEKFLKKLFKK